MRVVSTPKSGINKSKLNQPLLRCRDLQPNPPPFRPGVQMAGTKRHEFQSRQQKWFQQIKIKINQFFVVETQSKSLAFSAQRPKGWDEKVTTALLSLDGEKWFQQIKIKINDFFIVETVHRSPRLFGPASKWLERKDKSSTSWSRQQKMVPKT